MPFDCADPQSYASTPLLSAEFRGMVDNHLPQGVAGAQQQAQQQSVRKPVQQATQQAAAGADASATAGGAAAAAGGGAGSAAGTGQCNMLPHTE